MKRTLNTLGVVGAIATGAYMLAPTAVAPLPVQQVKTVYFQYPPGMNRSNYVWWLEASAYGGADANGDGHWFQVRYDKPDTNGFVTIKADKDYLVFRMHGKLK